MTVEPFDRTLAYFLLGHISTGSWTPLPLLKGMLSEGERRGAVPALAFLVREKLVWRSHEVIVVDGWPELIPRFSRVFQIGDPPIGRKIIREAAE